MVMKAELYVHLMELITESDRRAEQHPNHILRETYRKHAELLRKTLAHYEEVGENPKLEEAILKLKMDEES
jgi:hypothetical protein